MKQRGLQSEILQEYPCIDIKSNSFIFIFFIFRNDSLFVKDLRLRYFNLTRLNEINDELIQDRWSLNKFMRLRGGEGDYDFPTLQIFSGILQGNDLL